MLLYFDTVKYVFSKILCINLQKFTRRLQSSLFILFNFTLCHTKIIAGNIKVNDISRSVVQVFK